MHIGLIGGIGPAATEFYYRGLIDRHARAGTTLDLTIVHADVHEMARNLSSGDAQKQAQVFAGLIGRLAAAGAKSPRWAAISVSASWRRSRRCRSSTPSPR
jgi:aspartate racemase